MSPVATSLFTIRSCAATSYIIAPIISLPIGTRIHAALARYIYRSGKSVKPISPSMRLAAAASDIVVRCAHPRQ